MGPVIAAAASDGYRSARRRGRGVNRYTALGRPTSIASATQTIADSVPGNHGNRSMTYDALDRLTDVSSPMYGAIGAHYSYNVLDNLTGVTAPSTGGSLKAYCYDEGASWQLTNVKAGSCGGVSEIGLGYDVQGNLANKNGILYGFDYGNRLRGTSTERYRYDAWGRRVRTDSVLGAGLIYSLYGQDGTLYWTRDERTGRRMQYVYLGGSLIAQRMRPIGVTAETVTWQHTDALGSPVAVTNASRTVIQTSDYEPYGYLLNRPLEDGPGFTGHVMDAATGLIYMQQRYMSVGIPRFLSADPVTAYQQPFSNFNPYAYAQNNPYTNTDPDGRACNGRGCWVTSEERAAKNAGDWKLYYYLAGEIGADPYARIAGEIASNTGHDELSVALSAATNLNLDRGISAALPNGGSPFMRQVAIEFTKEAIRVDLMRGHANLLDSRNATESNPVQLDRAEDLTQLHSDVFKAYGVDPNVFGGGMIDKIFGNSSLGEWGNEKIRETYDWCPSPSCKK